jgi:succinate-acetate transporter protein
MAAVDPRSGAGGIRQTFGEAAPVHDRSWYELATSEDEAGWRARSRIVLQPIAAPSIMGLFGFAIATMMVGAWLAGWYGTVRTPLILWPFAFFAGGVLQMIAAIFSFRARDGVALAVHTAWGAFWMGWSVLELLVTMHVMAPILKGTINTAFAFWFIALAAVTISATFASLGQSLGVFVTLGCLSAACCLAAAGFWAGNSGVTDAGGWLFVASAAAAWLTATAMMLESAYGRTILPLGKWSRSANVPGRQPTSPVEFPGGMPGVKVGQ